MELFTHYCNALFYYNFENCDIRAASKMRDHDDMNIVVPNLSDDYRTLLNKLNSLQWNALYNYGKLTQKPKSFTNKGILIKDPEMIESLKNNR